jgi:hypothetical protein
MFRNTLRTVQPTGCKTLTQKLSTAKIVNPHSMEGKDSVKRANWIRGCGLK